MAAAAGVGHRRTALLRGRLVTRARQSPETSLPNLGIGVGAVGVRQLRDKGACSEIIASANPGILLK